MRFVFHAMLGVAVAGVATGLVCGVVERHAGAAASVVHGAIYRDVERRAPAERTIAPPLPLLPRYGEVVAPGAPLVWHLLEGTDGARVELAPTADFDPARTRIIDVDGETMKLPGSVGAGVWYWRLRGSQRGLVGEQSTPTWMLDVSTPVDSYDPAG